MSFQGNRNFFSQVVWKCNDWGNTIQNCGIKTKIPYDSCTEPVLQHWTKLIQCGNTALLDNFGEPVTIYTELHRKWDMLLLHTLMACPKKPFPSISPWMRSQGRKIRWDQLEGERRDSERPISRVRTGGSLGDEETGDLQVLLLRLQYTS